MTEEAKARVFDPFFSSKALGRGLGLASAQGILRGIGGAVRVVSSPGHGSTFNVWLPCWESRPESEEASSAGSSRAPAMLLVDDEDLLRAAVERALQREGFSVIAARDGVAAVDLFARHSRDIDVVILDLALPFLSGREVCEKMRELKRDIQVLFTSGHDFGRHKTAQRTNQRALSSKTLPARGSGPNASGDDAASARHLKSAASLITPSPAKSRGAKPNRTFLRVCSEPYRYCSRSRSRCRTGRVFRRGSVNLHRPRLCSICGIAPHSRVPRLPYGITWKEWIEKVRWSVTRLR